MHADPAYKTDDFLTDSDADWYASAADTAESAARYDYNYVYNHDYDFDYNYKCATSRNTNCTNCTNHTSDGVVSINDDSVNLDSSAEISLHDCNDFGDGDAYIDQVILANLLGF